MTFLKSLDTVAIALLVVAFVGFGISALQSGVVFLTLNFAGAAVLWVVVAAVAVANGWRLTRQPPLRGLAA
jgi:hypothetical protein